MMKVLANLGYGYYNVKRVYVKKCFKAKRKVSLVAEFQAQAIVEILGAGNLA